MSNEIKGSVVSASFSPVRVDGFPYSHGQGVPPSCFFLLVPPREFRWQHGLPRKRDEYQTKVPVKNSTTFLNKFYMEF